MKVLLLSCNTGGGHNSAGRAVFEALQTRGVPCDFVDTLTFASRRVSRNVDRSYAYITTKIPRFFHLLYRAGTALSHENGHSPVQWANAAYADALGEYIIQGGYDAVVTSHLFPAEALTCYRRKHSLPVKTVGVMTDYTCTPFWEETRLDRYVTPHPDLQEECLAKGFPAEKLLPFGIPVRAAFRAKTPQAEARAALDLPQDRPVYLVMSGSMGFGNLGALAQNLLAAHDGHACVCVLCGTNAALKARLDETFRDTPAVRTQDFTREVPLYMDACDVLFTKPGGLTSTEAAVKNVPMIHTAPIPGCETKNAAFFSARGLSLSAQTPEEQAAAASALLAQPEARAAMCAAQRSQIRPDAADAICDLLAELTAG